MKHHSPNVHVHRVNIMHRKYQEYTYHRPINNIKL